MAVGKVGLLDLVLLVSLLLSLKDTVTPAYRTNMASTAFASGVDYDFNVTIRICKMNDVDGINSTTADDTAYTEGWTIYLYKDDGLFDQSQQTTGADGCFTWRNLGPGSYMAIEADVDGWISTGPTNHDFGVVQGNYSYSFTFTNFKLHRLNTTLTLDFPTTTIQLFPVTLKATLKDERGNPVQGVWIRFRFPGGGMGVEAGILTNSDRNVKVQSKFFNNYLEIAGIYSFTAFLRTPLASKTVTKAIPMSPPIKPPTACRPAQPMTPPQLTKAGAPMKRVPMIKPATAADSTERESIATLANNEFLKTLSYLMRFVVTSKKILAAVNPRKCNPAGLNIKFMTVAMNPTAVTAQSFLTHQTVTRRIAKPIMSHRIGSPNILNTMGEKRGFKTPQRAENKAIAAISRVSK